MTEFCRSLNGSNCTVGGQTIISLQVAEDVDADYDTASAVCLAPGGPHARGRVVETVEGGVSTGYWHVEEARRIRSGEQTWRRRSGTGAWGHLPLYVYRLRRMGYLVARSTLTPSNIGRDNFPPRFMFRTDYWMFVKDVSWRHDHGEISYWEEVALRASWRPVADGSEIVRTICGWVGLPVIFRTSLPECASDYTPVGKSVIAAVREIASWSGASCCLDRQGRLVVYDWMNTYNRAGSAVPRPAVVLSEEIQDGIYSANTVTVVGSSRRVAHPSKQDLPADGPIGGMPYWKMTAVEVTESMALAAGERPAEERIEIRDYAITPELGRRLARERLVRYALSAITVRMRGPAEGSQHIAPVTNPVFEVVRSLEWTGRGYRYEIEITGPRTHIFFPNKDLLF